MLYYYILTYIKLHSIYTTSATTTIKIFSQKKEKENNDNQILLGGIGGSIRPLALISFIKSELPCRALCALGVILIFIS